MARRTLDLLPLLDVFMVVLFVFATIQEGEIDTTTHENEQLKATLEQAQTLAEVQVERARELAEQLEDAREAEQKASARAEMLDAENREFRQACGPSQGGELCPAATADARELVELADIQARTLDAIALFEIEIGGEKVLEDGVETGKMFERCCYRVDPPNGEWASCGVMPRTRQAREDWFDMGADGLRDALASTREGGTLVLLHQSELASHHAGMDLAALLRARLPSHHVQDNGVTDQLQCPLLAVDSSR